MPLTVDGVSLLPLWRGKPIARGAPLYWETSATGFAQAARLDDWKALRRQTGLLALFNLKTDPEERHNVANLHPDVVAKLEAALKAAHSAPPATPPTP